jgi:signal transduction histidine kinase
MGLAFYINDFTSATISTDYQRLFQILVNLIQNALKFSEKGYILVEIQ